MSLQQVIVATSKITSHHNKYSNNETLAKGQHAVTRTHSEQHCGKRAPAGVAATSLPFAKPQRQWDAVKVKHNKRKYACISSRQVVGFPFLKIVCTYLAVSGPSFGSEVVAHEFPSCDLLLQLPCSGWDLSSPTRDQTPVSCIVRWILNHWTTREGH